MLLPPIFSFGPRSITGSLSRSGLLQFEIGGTGHEVIDLILSLATGRSWIDLNISAGLGVVHLRGDHPDSMFGNGIRFGSGHKCRWFYLINRSDIAATRQDWIEISRSQCLLQLSFFGS